MIHSIILLTSTMTLHSRPKTGAHIQKHITQDIRPIRLIVIKPVKPPQQNVNDQHPNITHHQQTDLAPQTHHVQWLLR